MNKKVFTIGHSNRSIEELLRLLLKYDVKILADVRRFPTSKHPHFKQGELKKYLLSAGIKYHWFERLGGYRKTGKKDSPNVAIKTPGFRNYADYMMTSEFRDEIKTLMMYMEREKVAIMCAEKFFWRCHRKFISDYLLVHGFDVYHIIDESRLIKHKLSREARVVVNENIKTIIYDLIENNSERSSTSHT
jgi:uncharacterized protein (DUF488 family)